jgi:hypothetical protein
VIDYVEIATRALERWQTHAELAPQTQKAELACSPESLRELADERAAESGEPETAPREVWLSWAEWKARDLNRIFQERGLTGQPGRINAETVRRGELGAWPLK